MVNGDQRGVRKCYLSSTRKAKPQDINVVIVDMDMIDVVDEQGREQEDVEMVDALEKVFVLDEIDLV